MAFGCEESVCPAKGFCSQVANAACSCRWPRALRPWPTQACLLSHTAVEAALLVAMVITFLNHPGGRLRGCLESGQPHSSPPLSLTHSLTHRYHLVPPEPFSLCVSSCSLSHPRWRPSPTAHKTIIMSKVGPQTAGRIFSMFKI